MCPSSKNTSFLILVHSLQVGWGCKHSSSITPLNSLILSSTVSSSRVGWVFNLEGCSSVKWDFCKVAGSESSSILFRFPACKVVTLQLQQRRETRTTRRKIPHRLEPAPRLVKIMESGLEYISVTEQVSKLCHNTNWQHLLRAECNIWVSKLFNVTVPFFGWWRIQYKNKLKTFEDALYKRQNFNM